ncbi:hypothetical protein Tco_0721605 [Tanacetum coccineum]
MSEKFHGVPMTAFSEDGLSVIATKLDTSFMLDYYTAHMCIESWGRSSYARALIELQADMEWKDIIVVATSKLVELKNPKQASRGVHVDREMRFKRNKQAYTLVSNKNSASTSSTKKQVGQSRQEVDSMINADSDSELEDEPNQILGFMASTTLISGSDSGYVIIMAQQQHAADVHPDELCPPNKIYDLMDANKKIDFEHVQCPPESKILTNINQNHPLRFSIAASSSVPWIYMAQFWHTLKDDRSKYRLTFMLDRKEIYLTLDDFRTIFHLPHANANNHKQFMPPPSFVDMIPFYKNELGFTMELKTSSSFKTTGLLQPWQTLCKIFSKCLTTRVTGWDQPPLQIVQMLYCFVNNIHVDYAELLWEGLYYSLHHSTTSIPYPRFTKIIIGHYMTNFPEISRRARDKYHNLNDDDLMKNIFNSGRYKDKVGMKILDWMITYEMKLMEHYRMYAEVFGLDVPMTQSQPTESTQGTHRTLSALRLPNPEEEAGESSAPRRSTVIRLRIP